MSPQPLISIVVPTYNCSRFVAQAVESALAQTYSPIEVIVVDDGSTDDTREKLEPFQSRIRYRYQTNGGVSTARNRGIKEARGELIAFLDADDVWLPEKLMKQWESLQAQPECPLIHTDIYHLQEPAGERIRAQDQRERLVGSCYLQLFWRNAITTSSVLVRRSCLEEVGLFDEEIRGASTEDKDLWLRIARSHPFAYIGEPLVVYRLHETNGTGQQCKMAEDEHFVLAKALKSDPDLQFTLGRNRVRRWMSDLAFQAGYGNIDRGDLRRARKYFRAAIAQGPMSPRNWAFWASTFIPQALRRPLRSAKQRLSFGS